MARHCVQAIRCWGIPLKAVVVVAAWCGGVCALPAANAPLVPANTVGRVAANRYAIPTGQALTPAGEQVELPGMRPQVLALSPDGSLLATAGKTNVLVLLDPASGRVLQTVPLLLKRAETGGTNSTPMASPSTSNRVTTGSTATNSPATGSKTNRADMSLNGLVFSPDGRRLFLSNARGNVWAFDVASDNTVGNPVVLPLPNPKVPGKRLEIPAGLAVSADGRRLYVAGNLANRLYELDPASGSLLRSWDTGVAPYDVVLAGSKAYVSNLGGRRPISKDLTAPAGQGTKVRVDSVRYIPNEGSITVVDLAAGKVRSEVQVGLHPSALAVSPGGQYVVVANTGSDTLSVIDTATDQVIERIPARLDPGDLFGAQPNALAFEPRGRRLYVCNGTQNAVAVVQFDPLDKASKVLGLIPVGWFPAAVQFDTRRKALCVANLKGIGAMRLFSAGKKPKLNSKDAFGTVSLVPMPSDESLAALTAAALEDLRQPRIEEALRPARAGEPPRPVPERAGEPSLITHVVYVIKENRTYDQILGDMPEGNGDAALCTFGEQYTPNQHEIARQFVLLDNTYCSGICSSDGHQWTDSAIANEYVERQLTSDSPRSYTGGKGADAVDALAWASSGFIWDNARAHGRSFRNYGEWMLTDAGWRDPRRKDKLTWRDFWQDYCANSGATRLRSHASLDGLRGISDTNTVGWDLRVPDVMRAAEFIRELNQFETNGGFPEFILLFLPNDHTGGTRGESPTPGAQIADNDLALGRVVEALSHSRFWPEICLLAIEDDPQAGWDHVNGYRTTCYVVSPYTRRNQTVSTQYNQTSLIRTMELMLGLPPMNQLDAAASPMSDCFTATPDLTPFVAVTNRFPLDRINPEPRKVTDRRLRRDALVSARLPLDQADRCPEDLLNRILWRAMKGPDAPYPEWAVRTVRDKD